MQMWPERVTEERMRKAIDELKGLIRARYPDATFTEAYGDDPEGIYLRATVDVEEFEEVLNACGDRLLDMQVEEGLPVYVIPVQPEHRILERLRARKPSPD